MKFVLLTRLTPGAVREPRSLAELEHRAMDRIRAECPNVEWLQSYAAFGRFDYLDVIEAQDLDAAAKVAVLLRSYGRAHAEVMPVLEWTRFKTILEGMGPPERELDL